MDPKVELKNLDAERAELLTKANDGTITEAEVTRADEVVKRMAVLVEVIAKRDAATKALTSAGRGTESTVVTKGDSDDEPEGRTLGERFVKSAAMKAHREANPLGVTGKPVSIKADNLGGFVSKADGDPAPVGTGLTGARVYERQPGIVDLTYPKRPTILDLITRGLTGTSYVEYRQLLAVQAAAAVVQEGALKPLTTLTTGVAQAAAHVVADGVKVTNQELADDGILASLLDSILTRNLWLKVEDLVLNGTGVNEPRGILNTTGVLAQAFADDIPTTIRKAITVLRETSDTEATAVILSPEDDEALDLLKDGNDRFYGNGPFGIGPDTIWGLPRFVSSKVATGKAILGDFGTVQLLERQGLTVEAFNQNEDDARHNLTYIRAEVREMLLIREPAKLLVATLAGA